MGHTRTGRSGDLDLGVSFGVAFSPDGARLASCGQTSVSLWDVEAGERIWEATGLRDTAQIAFAPGGAALAVKSTRGRLCLLDASDGRVVHVLDKGTYEGAAPVFSTSGAFLVDGSWHGDLTVRDAASGDVVRRRSFPGEMITAVHVHAERWLSVHAPTASAGPARPDYVSIWVTALEGEPAGRFDVGQAGGSALSPEGDRLVVARAALREIAIFSVPGGREICTSPSRPGGTSAVVRWSRRGIIASVQDGRVELLRGQDLARVGGAKLPDPCDVAFAPAGDRVALGSWSRGVVTSVQRLLDDG